LTFHTANKPFYIIDYFRIEQIALTTRFWWPGHTPMVEKVVTQCAECQLATANHRKEPLKHEPLPPKAFHTIAADFKGPTSSGHYALVLIDLYSSSSHRILHNRADHASMADHYIVKFNNFAILKTHSNFF